MGKFNLRINAGISAGIWLVLFLTSGAAAQTPVAHAPADRHLGTKTPYPAPVAEQTAPPQGYHPVFVNYTGRHGARYMTKAGPDIHTQQTMLAAEKAGGLTPLGLDLLKMVDRMLLLEQGNYENITGAGAKEQEGIAARMRRQLPEVFQGRGLDVVVTFKVRTRQSADAFLRGMGVQTEGTASVEAHPANQVRTINKDQQGAGRAYRGPVSIKKTVDSQDYVLRFYDLSPAYLKYKKGAMVRRPMDSLASDPRMARTANSVVGRLFKPVFVSDWSEEQKINFAGDLYDLYSAQYSLGEEMKQKGYTRDSIDLVRAFAEDELAWMECYSDAEDFLEKGPAADPLGIQVKIAAPLLADMVKKMDTAAAANLAGNAYSDATLRFTHAEAISPLATLLGIPEASVAARSIFDYRKHWQAAGIIPLSANIQWILYAKKGKGDSKVAEDAPLLVKILLNEREIRLPIGSGRSAYYNWADLRRYLMQRLTAVGALLSQDMGSYLKEVK